MRIAIDASRNRSGGTIAHLDGILSNIPDDLQSSLEIHIWSYKACLDKLPDYQWLHKHSPKQLEKSIFHQTFWQRFIFPKELERRRCDILFKTTASSICPFEPSVTLSQDMLPFEPGETKRFGLSIARIRLKILQALYIRSLRSSQGVIFLTNYASEMIQRKTGKLNEYRIIPHGVPDFFRIPNDQIESKIQDDSNGEHIKVIYISELSPYKHQDKVAQSIYELNKKGFNFDLTLVGGGSGSFNKKFMKLLKKIDPKQIFIHLLPFLERDELPIIISQSDIYLFASSCENLPITVLEGMASGKPMVSSNRGPMPEVLDDGAFFFDPENISSIQDALLQVIKNPDIAKLKVQNNLTRSKIYNWKKCSHDTFEFLRKVNKDYSN